MLFSQDINLSKKLQTSALAIALMGEKIRYSLRIKASDLVAFKKASGLKLPTKIGKSVRAQHQIMLCLGPDEWMIIAAPKNGQKLKTTLAKMATQFVYSYVDISHRNIALIMTGPHAAQAVNIGCPLDLSLEALPIGKVTRTVFENAPIMLLRTGAEEFHLETWRSFAPYICGLFDRYEADINSSIDK